MCFNYKVSLLTFAIGTTFSLLLIYKGNKKYTKENHVFGIFGLFIALIQFMEFIFWIDIKNKYCLNKLATIIGPILNVGQPLILYGIKKMIYVSNFGLIEIINMIYFLFIIKMYYKFINNEKLITKTNMKSKHLEWPWLKYSNPELYLIVFAINIFYLTNKSNFNYELMFFLITYTFLLISVKYFYYSAGQMWCFFGAFIPFIMFIMSYKLI